MVVPSPLYAFVIQSWGPCKEALSIDTGCLDPLCSFTIMVKFCPGDTRVRASCSRGTPAAGPPGPTTLGSSDTFIARLTAVSACSCFSRSTVSSPSFFDAFKLLFSVRRIRESSFCSTSNNGFAVSLISFSARALAVLICSAMSFNSVRRPWTFFSSSPSLGAKPAKLVSIPSKKSFS